MSQTLPVMKIIRPDYAAPLLAWRTRVFLNDVEIPGLVKVSTESQPGGLLRVYLEIAVERVEVSS